MLSDQQRDLLEFRRQLYRPTPRQTVVEWAESNLKLTQRQTEHPGPFSTAVRPYMREPLECWKDPGVFESTLCWGSQTAKTTTLMAGLAWLIENEPSPAIWLMPSENLARSFSKSRWMPMLEDSPTMLARFPADKDRMTNLEQNFDRCTLTFVGSNSPANVASRPVRILIADEVDKCAAATDKEADSLDLIEQRLKAFSSSKAFLTSTPTITEGRIWQRFLRGDQRFYYIPCPNCRERIKLDWKQVKWDEAAKDAEGKWDFGRVRASARYECQLCKGAITDAQKVAALRHGLWVAENKGAMPGVRSYHLSSLYSPDRKCTWGFLAVAFLEATQSVLGLQGFVNGNLAEPWENQSAPRQREELVVAGAEAVGDDAVKIMSVDCQASSPHFWFVVRAWNADGSSRALDAGSLDTWQDVRDKQTEHGVQDVHVVIDSGYDAPAVYAECLRWGRYAPRAGKVPLFVGWIPAKGMPRKGWRNPATGLEEPFFLRGIDPRVGDNAGRQGRLELKLLEFATDSTKDILDRLRRGQAGIRWEVADNVAGPEYWRHLDCEHKVARLSSATGRTTWTWLPRSSRWPNHMADCEVMSVAAAIFHRRLALGPKHEGNDATQSKRPSD
jgi:phage terminase large subunit GpA-like protein